MNKTVRYHLSEVLKAEGLPSFVAEGQKNEYVIFIDKPESLTPRGDAFQQASKVCEGMKALRYDLVSITDITEGVKDDGSSAGDYRVSIKVD